MSRTGYSSSDNKKNIVECKNVRRLDSGNYATKYFTEKIILKIRIVTPVIFSAADLLGNTCDRRYISICLWTDAIKRLLSSCAYQKYGVHQHFHDASGNDINKVCLCIHL